MELEPCKWSKHESKQLGRLLKVKLDYYMYKIEPILGKKYKRNLL